VAEIRAVTGWNVAEGTSPAEAPASAGLVCNWVDDEAGGVVQVQVHRGATEMFDTQRRSLSDRGARSARMVTIAGAARAFEVAPEGILGMIIGRDYVAVTVIGGTAGIDDHRQLGVDVAGALR
jgi:hypothetical protein